MLFLENNPKGLPWAKYNQLRLFSVSDFETDFDRDTIRRAERGDRDAKLSATKTAVLIRN